MASKKKAKKPPKPKKPKTVHARHPAAQLGKSTTAADEPKGLAPSGGAAARELEAPTSNAGLADVILDLVGEGVASLHQGLMAWQREQDRIANRAWRRPGGMARMGGL